MKILFVLMLLVGASPAIATVSPNPGVLTVRVLKAFSSYIGPREAFVAANADFYKAANRAVRRSRQVMAMGDEATPRSLVLLKKEKAGVAIAEMRAWEATVDAFDNHLKQNLDNEHEAFLAAKLSAEVNREVAEQLFSRQERLFLLSAELRIKEGWDAILEMESSTKGRLLEVEWQATYGKAMRESYPNLMSEIRQKLEAEELPLSELYKNKRYRPIFFVLGRGHPNYRMMESLLARYGWFDDIFL